MSSAALHPDVQELLKLLAEAAARRAANHAPPLSKST